MNDTSSPYSIYLKEVSSIPALSREEEFALVQAKVNGEKSLQELSLGIQNSYQRDRLEESVKAGDEANSKLLEANLLLVVNIVSKYNLGPNVSMDLIQEGNIGLQNGIDRFDPNKGFRLATYVTFWIKKEISLAVQKQRSVRLPAHIISYISKIKQASRDIEQEEEREASITEIADRVDIDPTYVKQILSLSISPYSIHEEYGTEEGDEMLLYDLVDNVSTDTVEIVQRKMLVELLSETIDTILDDMEAAVVKLRNGIEDGVCYSLLEASKKIGITRNRARILEIEAMKKLKNSEALREYYYQY